MTDEQGRENFKKYGNPDGRGSMQVAIGLPKFLLEAENAVSALIVAFAVLIVILPGLFFYGYRNSMDKDSN